MYRIFFLAFVIYSGVLPRVIADVINFHPSLESQEQREGEDFAISCEVKGAESIQWIDPRNQPVPDKRTRSIFVEKMQTMLQLRFQPLNVSHAGSYTCVARIGGTEQKKTLNLSVIKPITFKDKLREYHALLGSNQTLLCEVESNPPAIISWSFKEQPIEGEGYIELADGLQIINVTEEKLGDYKCTASLTTNNNGLTKSIILSLKKAIPPKITSPYKNNTVHGIANSIVSIRCPVVADPWPEIKWIRGNRELKAPNYNSNITNTPNGSILQFVLTGPELLGNYTCKAANSFNTTSITFTLEEGELPAVPTVVVRETDHKSFRLDIYPNSTQELSNYRVIYKKSNEDDSSWKVEDFGLKDSATIPYSVENLVPDTEYMYKVGACSQDDLCAFTNITSTRTQRSATTSSTSTIHTVVTQVFALLPAFILGIMQQHRTT